MRRARRRRAGGPWVLVAATGYLDRTMKASTSIRGCPAVPSTLTTTLCAPWVVETTSTISAVLGEAVLVLMVTGDPASSLTVAEPRVGPWVDIQATWKPVKLNVAVLPATVAKSTDPPLAPERVCRVQPAEYFT